MYCLLTRKTIQKRKNVFMKHITGKKFQKVLMDEIERKKEKSRFFLKKMISIGDLFLSGEVKNPRVMRRKYLTAQKRMNQLLDFRSYQYKFKYPDN